LGLADSPQAEEDREGGSVRCFDASKPIALGEVPRISLLPFYLFYTYHIMGVAVVHAMIDPFRFLHLFTKWLASFFFFFLNGYRDEIREKKTN
jgi:hypothetical protein